MPRRCFRELHWFTLKIRNRIRWECWAVIFTSDELNSHIDWCTEDEEYFGLTYRRTRTLYIWAGLTKRQLPEILFHEQCHAHYTHELDITDKNEEQAITLLSPRLAPTLTRQGWTLPPLPRGWAQLHRHACRVRAAEKKGTKHAGRIPTVQIARRRGRAR